MTRAGATSRPPRCCGGGSWRSSCPCARRCTRTSRAGPAPTWCWPRAGTPSTPPCCCRTAAPAPTSCRTTSPSSSPPRPSRSGRRAPTSSASTGSPPAAGCATCWPSATAWRAAGSGSAWTTACTARCRSSAATTPSSTTRASSPRAARCRSGRSRSTSSSAGGRIPAWCIFGQADELDLPFEYELLGVTSPERAGLALRRGHRRALPLADQLLADPAGDDGLRAALRGPGRRLAPRRRSAATAAWSWPPRIRWRSPPRSSGCSPTRSTGAAAPRPAWRSWRRPPGTWRPSRWRPGCARRCAGGVLRWPRCRSRPRRRPPLWPRARLVRVALLCLLAFALLRGLLMGLTIPPLLGARRGLPLPLRRSPGPRSGALTRPDKPLYPREYSRATKRSTTRSYCCGAGGRFVGDPKASIRRLGRCPTGAASRRDVGRGVGVVHPPLYQLGGAAVVDASPATLRFSRALPGCVS